MGCDITHALPHASERGQQDSIDELEIVFANSDQEKIRRIVKIRSVLGHRSVAVYGFHRRNTARYAVSLRGFQRLRQIQDRDRSAAMVYGYSVPRFSHAAPVFVPRSFAMLVLNVRDTLRDKEG